MKRQAPIYVGLCLIAVFLGLFIGGGPDALRSTGPLPTVPDLTTLPAPDETTTTVADADDAPATSEPDTPTSTEPVTTTTETAPSTDAPTTIDTTTTTTTTTTTATTTTTSAPEDEPIELRAPDDFAVGVANASGAIGAAGRLVDQLVELGYTSASPFDAVPIDDTLVFHAPDFAAEAEALADAIGLSVDDLRPLSEAPELFTSRLFPVVVVLGTEGGGEVPS